MIQNACMNAERLWKQGSCCACRFHKFALDLSLSACTLGVPHSNQWSSENSFVRFESRSMINLFAALKWNGIGSTSTCFYLEVLDDENDFSRSLTVRRGGSLEALFLRWERPKTPNPYAARTSFIYVRIYIVMCTHTFIIVYSYVHKYTYACQHMCSYFHKQKYHWQIRFFLTVFQLDFHSLWVIS